MFYANTVRKIVILPPTVRNCVWRPAGTHPGRACREPIPYMGFLGDIGWRVCPHLDYY